jgi:hypothetical protein
MVSSQDLKNAISGALVVDKPTGMTSHDVVQAVRNGTGIRRAGHTGTLDPRASGVLVVLLGPAVRLSGSSPRRQALPSHHPPGSFDDTLTRMANSHANRKAVDVTNRSSKSS